MYMYAGEGEEVEYIDFKNAEDFKMHFFVSYIFGEIKREREREREAQRETCIYIDIYIYIYIHIYIYIYT